jgi:hypothetical protein
MKKQTPILNQIEMYCKSNPNTILYVATILLVVVMGQLGMLNHP